MFQDTQHFTDNKVMQGKVFGFELVRTGLARSDRKAIADIEEWDDFLECPEFDHCYGYSMAKLTLEAARAKDYQGMA